MYRERATRCRSYTRAKSEVYNVARLIFHPLYMQTTLSFYTQSYILKYGRWGSAYLLSSFQASLVLVATVPRRAPSSTGVLNVRPFSRLSPIFSVPLFNLAFLARNLIRALERIYFTRRMETPLVITGRSPFLSFFFSIHGYDRVLRVCSLWYFTTNMYYSITVNMFV